MQLEEAIAENDLLRHENIELRTDLREAEQRLNAKLEVIAKAVLEIKDSVAKFDELAEALNGSAIGKMFGMG